MHKYGGNLTRFPHIYLSMSIFFLPFLSLPIYAQICIYIYIYTDIYKVYMHIYIYMHVHIHIYMYIYIYLFVCVYVYVYIYICSLDFLVLYIYIYTHVGYIHTVLSSSLSSPPPPMCRYRGPFGLYRMVRGVSLRAGGWCWSLQSWLQACYCLHRSAVAKPESAHCPTSSALSRSQRTLQYCSRVY